MKMPALSPYGRALRDYHAGAVDAVITVHSDLGEHEEMSVSIFFREGEGLFPFERVALDLCRGTVLDLGAGVGVHALALQDRGLEVQAIEIVPEAVEIMRARGVRQVIEGDGREYAGEPVDTIIMLMNGVGPLGTLAGLDAFLKRAAAFLRPGGQILLDSGAVERRTEDAEAPSIAWPEAPSAYPGEAWVRLEYQGELGDPFRELYADGKTLTAHARRAGWNTETVFQSEGGSYVARLTRGTP